MPAISHTKTFTLRPYQQKFCNEIAASVGKFKQIVACAATGSGKTKCFIEITKRAHAKGFTVLIITEASKIYSQLINELPNVGNINADKKDGYIHPGHIYIAMAQSLINRKIMVQQFVALGENLLIINDEAHISTSTKLLQRFLPAALLIGFTATPDFKFAKHLPLLYQSIIIGAQPDELITDGFLCPYRHFARVLADLDDLKIKNGEFTEESQQAVFESRRVKDGLLTDLATTTYRKAIIFTSSIKHCEDTFALLTEAGYNAIQVHSKVPKAQQTFDMANFTEGDINICVSVGILTKGWDYPPIDLVVLDRATTSLPLYLQMIGRGSRISPNKTHFTVLDYGGNYSRHGLWDANIDWNKKWNTKPKKSEGVAPIKNCPACDYINPVSVTSCKNCGHVFTKAAPTEEEKEETKLIELTASYRTLIGRKISSLSASELALYAKLKNKKPYAARIAKAKSQYGNPHFSYPGWIGDYGAYMGYKRSWAEFNQPGEERIEFHDIELR